MSGEFANRSTLRDFLGKKIWVKLPARVDWFEATLTGLPVDGLVTIAYWDGSAGALYQGALSGRLHSGENVSRTYSTNDIQIKLPS